MNDVLLFQENERHEKLRSDLANQVGVDSLEVVRLDEVVQIVAEQFEDDAEVITEIHIVGHPYNELIVACVLVINVFENLHFDHGLMVKALLVSNKLDGHLAPSLVVDALHNLPEAPFPDDLQNLISVCNMVPNNEIVVAALVIVAVIKKTARSALHFELLRLRRSGSCTGAG